MTYLRALALAATPGPWHHHLHDTGDSWPTSVYFTGIGGGPEDKPRIMVARAETPDAAFIAAASPTVVLALLDVVDAARDCVGVLPLPLRIAGDGHPIIDTLTAHSAEVDALRAALARASEVMGE